MGSSSGMGRRKGSISGMWRRKGSISGMWRRKGSSSGMGRREGQQQRDGEEAVRVNGKKCRSRMSLYRHCRQHSSAGHMVSYVTAVYNWVKVQAPPARQQNTPYSRGYVLIEGDEYPFKYQETALQQNLRIDVHVFNLDHILVKHVQLMCKYIIQYDHIYLYIYIRSFVYTLT